MGYLYVDSGSVYRAVTSQALKQEISADDAAQLAELAASMDIAFYVKGGRVCFKVGGLDLGRELRSEAVDREVSPIAVIPAVRRMVVSWLRDMTQFGDIVMEGRDIGTAVFPGAKFKFYLDAEPAERTRRRHAELAAENRNVDAERVGRSLRRRDRIDSGREADPLKAAPDAVVLDTTNMDIEQVVRAIVERLRAG